MRVIINSLIYSKALLHLLKKKYIYKYIQVKKYKYIVVSNWG